MSLFAHIKSAQISLLQVMIEVLIWKPKQLSLITLFITCKQLSLWSRVNPKYYPISYLTTLLPERWKQIVPLRWVLLNAMDSSMSKYFLYISAWCLTYVYTHNTQIVGLHLAICGNYWKMYRDTCNSEHICACVWAANCWDFIVKWHVKAVS